MSRSISGLVLTSVALLFAAAGSGCSHAKPQAEANDAAAAVDAAGLGSSDDGKAMGMRSVHFTYDSNALDAEAKSELKANAAVLKDHPGAHVQIEGHCDARGGIQYNIALGERRAKAVQRYLEDLGIASGRLETVSYGKERPLAQGSDEESYAKNRRAAFVVTQLK